MLGACGSRSSWIRKIFEKYYNIIANLVAIDVVNNKLVAVKNVSKLDGLALAPAP